MENAGVGCQVFHSICDMPESPEVGDLLLSLPLGGSQKLSINATIQILAG